jgi:hypothetical protein
MNEIFEKAKLIKKLKQNIIDLENDVADSENASNLIKENTVRISDLQDMVIEQLETKIEKLSNRLEKLKKENKDVDLLIKQKKIIDELSDLLQIINKEDVSLKDFVEDGDEKNSDNYEDKEKLSDSEGLNEVDRALIRMEEELVDDAENILNNFKNTSEDYEVDEEIDKEIEEELEKEKFENDVEESVEILKKEKNKITEKLNTNEELEKPEIKQESSEKKIDDKKKDSSDKKNIDAKKDELNEIDENEILLDDIQNIEEFDDNNVELDNEIDLDDK